MLYEEARAERFRQRREADRLRRQRETGVERDARFMRNSVLVLNEAYRLARPNDAKASV